MYFKRKRLDFFNHVSLKDVSVIYCCTKQTHQVVENEKVYLRKNMVYINPRFIKPENLELIAQTEFVSGRVKNQYEIKLPTLWMI